MNRLANETSPYLLQHRTNPVEWYPWGPEALERAKHEDKPIFLSVGYSACHWCHVMEHESFEDERIAKLMNEHFVNIKVDREERPDVDSIYMSAVQLMTGRGGWPMSVFLTPDLQPFYGGTYFPPSRRMGMPGFDELLLAVSDAWRNRREQAMAQAADLTAHLRAAASPPGAGGADELSDKLLFAAAASLERSFDHRHGGFGGAPKFPHPMDLKLLLRVWRRRAKRWRCCTWSRTRLSGWPRAGCTTSLAAGSIGTRSMSAGSCRTSRRCCTTTRSLSAVISMRIWSHGMKILRVSRGRRLIMCCGT